MWARVVEIVTIRLRGTGEFGVDDLSDFLDRGDPMRVPS